MHVCIYLKSTPYEAPLECNHSIVVAAHATGTTTSSLNATWPAMAVMITKITTVYRYCGADTVTAGATNAHNAASKMQVG